MEYVGTSYQGESKDGRFVRHYRYFWKKKTFTKCTDYKCLCDFRFEGKGKYNFSTDTKYDGELKDGTFHGKGTLLFENGAKYTAVWNEGIATEV